MNDMNINDKTPSVVEDYSPDLEEANDSGKVEAPIPRTLQSVMEEATVTLEDINQNSALPNANQPRLQESKLSNSQSNLQFQAWLQDTGYLALLEAKIVTLTSDMQIQALARKLAISLTRLVYDNLKEIAKSTEREAQLNFDKAMMEVNSKIAEACISLVSAGISVGTAAASHKYADKVQARANDKAAKAAAGLEKPKELDIEPAPAKSPGLKIVEEGPLPQGNGPRRQSVAQNAGDDLAANPRPSVDNGVGGPQPAPGGGRLELHEVPAGGKGGGVQKGGVEEFDVKNPVKPTDAVLSQTEMTSLSIFDNTVRGVMDGLMGAVKAGSSAYFQAKIADQQLDVDREKTFQASINALLELLRSFLETERKADEGATARFQEINMSSYNQANAVGFQRL